MYAVCDACWAHSGGAVDSALTGALSTFAELKEKGLGKFLSTTVIVLGMLLYLPVVKNALLILTCHATFQCEFERCYTDPDTKFLIAALLSIIGVAVVGVGMVVLKAYLLVVRYRSLSRELPHQELVRKSLFGPCKPSWRVTREEYEAFLDADQSMLRALYLPFDFYFFHFTPVLLVFKAATVVCIVVTAANSLSQLVAVATVEGLFALGLFVLSPYRNVWVEAISRVSCLHQVVQLSLFAFHRVDIRENPHGEGYGPQMIAVSATYVVAVIVLVLGVIFGPGIKAHCSKSKMDRELEEELERYRAEEQVSVGAA